MITHKKLLHICHYDPETGFFVWKNPIAYNHQWRRGRRMGKINSDGYAQIKIDNQHYSGGRLAWFYMTGKWPTKDIDHKNRIRSDNRWDNLREATDSQNGANSQPSIPSRSNYRGVIKMNNRWRANVKGRKPVCVGNFGCKQAAAVAYDLAAFKQFGEFAILNFPTAPQRDWILI